MSSLTLNLNLDNSDRINALFPKCRPRTSAYQTSPISTRTLRTNSTETTTTTDINLNNIVMETMNDRSCDNADGEESCSHDESSINDSNSDDDDDSGHVNNNENSHVDNKVILQLKKHNKPPTTYKLRDSRIIEIAGGREVYCQSRSKASRSKATNNAHRKNRSPGAIWELRSKLHAQCVEPKKSESNNEVTETVFSSEVSSVKHQRQANNANNTGLDGSVVFDDIGDDWRSTRPSRSGALSSGGSSPSPPLHHYPFHFSSNHPLFFKQQQQQLQLHPTSGGVSEAGSISSERDRGESNNKHDQDKSNVIGSLPIAQYEGSPRRYGQKPVVDNPGLPSVLSSPSVYLPKPGFPQRVMDEDSSSSQNNIHQSPVADPLSQPPPSNNSFDYLYEFSETRKVLEEFFKPGDNSCNNINNSNNIQFRDLEYELRRQSSLELDKKSSDKRKGSSYVGLRLASDELCGDKSPRKPPQEHRSECNKDSERDLLAGFSISTEMLQQNIYINTRKESILNRKYNRSPQSESENLSIGKSENLSIGKSRNFTLSPETTDCESNCGDLDSEISSLVLVMDEACPSGGGLTILPMQNDRLYSGMPVLEDGLSSGHASDTENNNPTVLLMKRQISEIEQEIVQRTNKINEEASQVISACTSNCTTTTNTSPMNEGGSKKDVLDPGDIDLQSLDPLNVISEQDRTPPPPAPTSHRSDEGVEATIKDIRMTLQRTKTLPIRPPPLPVNEDVSPPSSNHEGAPIWVPRKPGGSGPSADEDEADTDLETDRLLGQQRTNDEGYFDDKMDKDGTGKKKGRNKEGMLHEPAVLIEGVLFRARYLGSTQLVCEGQPTKSTRMMQAEEAVSRIKAPEGETQPSTEVDLFISTEKIMVLNTDLKEIMMDHALRTISYIADIGDLVVLMARRRFVSHDVDEPPKINRTPKMICHVFESDEAQFIAQSIGQAFQVAYMEFLKANGIEDHSFVKEMDYQEVLNSQEIFGDELQMFAKKELQKEVVVPKAKGEILGVVIVESGWGSMLPTVVIANLAPTGAAARCGQLNIGDQIIAVNGVSLVGLPLSTCQTYIKNSKNQTVVKLTVVPCAPVVEVKIKRPDTKYQLGFSVQNGVICSLLRGGIAERGGVRVGHRIIEINNQSVVAVPHEKIVNLLATSVGEILMKTMPTSMFRLLTGQETPVFI